MGFLKYRLSRLPYFLLTAAHELWLMLGVDWDHGVSLIIALASLPLRLILVVLPRVRDCGWPNWVGYLTLIPFVSAIPAVSLVFAPSKYFFTANE